jgi:putative ABC transport system permease protein
VFFLALRELLSRRTATLLAGGGLLTATLGFMILASTAVTTEATLRGDIGHAWQTSFDLLVRPSQSLAKLETDQGLVRPNYLGGSPGGITLAQLQAIRQISGVSVAAPIAVVGVVQTTTSAINVDLSSFVGNSPVTIFRVRAADSGQAGLSNYPWDPQYIVVAPAGKLLGLDLNSPMRIGNVEISCSYTVRCFGTMFCDDSGGSCHYQPLFWPIQLVSFPQPLMIVGVDPVAEDALVGLDKCVTSGRGLTGADQLQFTTEGSGQAKLPVVDMPMVAATHSFVNESLQVGIDLAANPNTLLNNWSPAAGNWQQVATQNHTADELYQTWLAASQRLLWATSIQVPGDVHYVQVGLDHLAATSVPPDLSAFGALVNVTSEQVAPIEAQDVWFRSISLHQWINSFGPGQPGAQPDFVGRFDPQCLQGFASGAGGQMESYAPPTVTLPGGNTLGPTRSPADYVNNAPTIITTLDTAAYFARPDRFESGLGAKFISAIRIRVAGTDQPGPVAQARLSRVAAAIDDATGLQVDIVKGSSPKTISVDLLAGKFGRPALTVREQWAVKGVAFRFQRAVSAQNLALFGLVLVGAMVLVGETGYISAVRRRREFGVLRALGWRTSSIAWLVELELVVLGFVAAVLALVIGVPIALRLGLGTSAWQLAAVVPLAVGVAALAGIIPALAAARGSVVAMIESTGQATITNRLPPGGVIGIAWRELRGQWRAEAALGAFAIALGAATLGVLVLISTAFRGQLDTTVLGTYLAGEVRPFHLVLAGLTLVVGAIAAAEVVTLSYLERRSHLGALRALGWPASAVLRFLVAQASVLGLGGGLTAVVVVVAAGLVLQAPLSAIGWGLLAALGMTFLATAIAVIAPLTHAYRANPADSLRGE